MKRAAKIVLLILCVQALTVALAQAQSSAVVPTPRADFAWGNRNETWMGRFYRNVQEVSGGEVDLLFIGDSITHSWERAGKATWDRYYAHRSAVNLGFGGDRTQHVLWRLIHGKLEAASPKVAVVMIGTNNSNSDTPDEIAAGVRAICHTLRGLLPETKILLLGIFPRGATPDDWRRNLNAAVNARIAELDDGEWIHYLDIGESFLEAGGILPESVMPDALHPNERGYQIWAEAMEPTLARLMGDTPVR
jgi:beta-glucosidase